MTEIAINSRIFRWQLSIKVAIVLSSAYSSVSGALRERVMLFGDHFAAHIIERQRGVVAAKTHANCVEITGFGDDGDSAAAPVEAC